jgi:hypothetical protein
VVTLPASTSFALTVPLSDHIVQLVTPDIILANEFKQI